jgi:hypothetical protein
MMKDDASVSGNEVKSIVDRAFVLQRYLLRRAWGTLYATASVSIFLSVFRPSILKLWKFPGNFSRLAA